MRRYISQLPPEFRELCEEIYKIEIGFEPSEEFKNSDYAKILLSISANNPVYFSSLKNRVKDGVNFEEVIAVLERLNLVRIEFYENKGRKEKYVSLTKEGEEVREKLRKYF